MQIFATDLSEVAIERARAANYPKSIAADVSPDRLRRFFVEANGAYQISKSIRDLCVFARQDLTRDPPFSKLDLIVCRNVLIYLGSILQKKLMTVFHYALKPHGFLMLGHAETVGIHADLFGITDKKHRVYGRKAVEPPPALNLLSDYSVPRQEPTRKATEPRGPTNIHSEANRLLLEKYTPPGVIVDSSLQILQFRGATGAFLEPAPGDASLQLLKMAREGLVFGLRSALRAARKTDRPVRREGLRVKYNGHGLDVSLDVIPLGPPGDDRHYLILFQSSTPRALADPPPLKNRPGKALKGRKEPTDIAELTRLEQELAASREYLQSVIQDMEAANEELQSANEEILSSNEELQSTNEELDTAKEELQSTNEELNTLNEELHGRNEELSRLNSDLVNLLASVQIAIVMVSSDLRIRRFTPMAETIFNLIPTDIGRPVGHIQPNIECPNLEQHIAAVIDSMSVKEVEVRDRQGRWYSMRIRPYKDIENRIDGALLALFDVDKEKRSQEQFDEVTVYAEHLLDAIHEPVMLLGTSLEVRSVNRAYAVTFGLAHKPKPGTPLEEFHGGVWSDEQLLSILKQVIAQQGGRDDYKMTVEFPSVGQRQVSLSARWFLFGSGQESVLVAIDVARK
jgi:two-component system CheB/CheR fusion protein